MNQLQTPFVPNLSLNIVTLAAGALLLLAMSVKFSPETTATFPKPICGYSSPSASSFSPTFHPAGARSAVRVFPPQPALPAPVDPHLNLVGLVFVELARGWAMLIGLTPLLRVSGALHHRRMARQEPLQSTAGGLSFSVLVFTYLASLVFYDYEILV